LEACFGIVLVVRGYLVGELISGLTHVHSVIRFAL
jgi:hypothetical protein